MSRKTEADIEPNTCPCCGRHVAIPTLEALSAELPPIEAAILGAIWRGRGFPVVAERVFDAMYADDPDGGPSPTSMYSSFKVGLCRLRKRLDGSGISIETVGYRRGYRLVLGA